MGRGLGNRVVAMAVHPGNGNLYVAGWFTNYWNDAGQSGDARYVAMWDREARAWTNVGAGFNNWVYALAFDSQSNLIAGGSFTNTYLGSHWTPLAEPCQAQRVAK